MANVTNSPISSADRRHERSKGRHNGVKPTHQVLTIFSCLKLANVTSVNPILVRKSPTELNSVRLTAVSNGA